MQTDVTGYALTKTEDWDRVWKRHRRAASGGVPCFLRNGECDHRVAGSNPGWALLLTLDTFSNNVVT